MTKTAPLAALLPLLATAAAASAQQPVIRRITPDVLRPGARMVVEGSGLRASGAQTAVTVNGKTVSVVSASPTRLVAEVPRSGFPCLGGAVPVEVVVGRAAASRPHPMSTGTPVSLAAGEARVFPGPSGACLELSRAGRYLLPVLNTLAHPDSAVDGRLKASEELAPRPVPPPPPPPSIRAMPLDADPAALPAPARRRGGVFTDTLPRDPVAHALALAQSLETVEVQAEGSPFPLGRKQLAQAPLSGRAGIRVGDLVPLRFGTSDQGCADHVPLTARAVYVGRYAVVLEDTRAPLYGTMNAEYEALGAEYDTVVHPLTLAHFGDPLAFDAQLDRDGRLLMLFTPVMNDSFPGRVGMVSSCDFYPAHEEPASNEGEVFYAVVPTHADSIGAWRWVARGTVVHEVNHLVSFASRFAQRSRELETSWLMEALAMQAEEIYARRFSGARWRGEASYEEQKIWCDYWREDRLCGGRPYGMTFHFLKLREYLEAPETRSPLRDITFLDPAERDPKKHDISFYGSAWSLLRWTVDHFSTSAEEVLLKRVMQEKHATGTANLAQGTGRGFPDLLVDWAIAAALDDAPGFTPRNPLHTIRSWKTSDIYGGLNHDAPADFPYPDPLALTALDGAAYDQPFRIGGATGTFFEVDVAGALPRVVEVSTQAGGRLPAALRVAVVRTQ